MERVYLRYYPGDRQAAVFYTLSLLLNDNLGDPFSKTYYIEQATHKISQRLSHALE